jgi:hypothetical protein
MRRTVAVTALSGLIAGLAIFAWHSRTTTAQTAGPAPRNAKPTSTQLPINQVVLFSSGVGYFQREGEVDGDTRVDMSFATDNINDLLKSLVLQDLGGGKITTISYDSFDPIDKTLRSFALDLTYTPSFGQLLNQARGEKVEVVLQQSNSTQPATMTGVIVGMESRKVKDSEVELLNLLCAEGMRNIPLEHIQRVRLLNPVLDAELRRALEVLASGHDTQKKTVSLAFTGNGKRNVRVGYVVENPIWKTSYRLVLSKDGKAHMQGWAMVENTQDEDWNNVRMVLISGRPISFQMDMYQPLYVPRPKVEPDQFASLRPPTYNGGMDNNAAPVAGAGMPAGMGGLGGAMNPFGLGGGMPGNPAAFVNRYNLGNNQFGNLGGQFGQQGGNPFGANGENRKLTYEELQQRRQELREAKDNAKKIIGPDPLAMDAVGSVSSAASTEEVGDYFQYAIDHKVSLPRQKSAMLPIVDSSVTGTKVSIFNESVHPKFPLLGLKLKNSSGLHLMQGPITVYDSGNYAGDTRIQDVQPGEERLVSYAIDQGVEVKAESRSAPEQLVAIKVVKGMIHVSNKLRQTRTYLVKNRTEHPRTLIIEHPIGTDWKLVTPEKPTERSRDVYRFQIEVPAGKTVKQEVIEEQTRADLVALTNLQDQTITTFRASNVSSPAVKEALQKAIKLRQGLADIRREASQFETRLKAITDDQTRLRANLDKVPAASAAHKRYLEKFDTQETEIEKLQDKMMQKQDALEKQQKEYEDFLATLNAE